MGIDELRERLPDLTVIEMVVDITARSGDAEFVLDEAEFDVPWFLCRVPRSMIVPDVPFSLLGLPVEVSPDREYEAQRTQAVAEWFGKFPTVRDALESEPPLMGFDGEKLYLIDGWHRLAYADASDEAFVTAFVAVVDRGQLSLAYVKP